MFSSSIVMSETTIPVVYWNQEVAQKLEPTLTTAGIAHDVKEYPEAGHSFLNNPGAWWFKELRVVDIGHSEAAAEGAGSRIVAFFRKHLYS
jgi:carboxymethylenebutenolidase